MLKRTISAIIALPILIIIVLLGGNVLRFSLLAITILGLYEFYRAFNREKNVLSILTYIFVLVYYFIIENINIDYFFVMIISYILLNLLTMVINHKKLNPEDVSINIFGFFYVCILMSTIYLTRSHDDGNYYVWLIFISAWGADTFAYFTGKALGKHKLIPDLSPNKTVEGAVGGVVGAILLGLGYGFYLSNYKGVVPHINIYLLFSLICGFGAILSIFGDLSASTIKRYTKIKDFGKIMPGHGGIMDRFDSILFTAPTVYMILRIIHFI